MALVKVKNRSDLDFVGVFKDKPINIKSGDFIEMGRAQAVQFLSEYSSVKVDGTGRHKMPKNLVMIEDPEEKAKRYDQPLLYRSFDGTMFRTTAGLQNHEASMQAQAKDLDNAKPTKRRTAPKPMPTI